MSRLARSRRGGNAVEFALTFPVLAALLVMVMDYGWYFSQQLAVTAAVRDAARVGAATGSDASPEDAAEDVLLAGLERVGYTGRVELDIRRTGEAPEQSLRVGVSLPYAPLVGMLPTPAKVSATLSMRIEHQQI